MKLTYLSVLGAGLWNNRLVLMLLLQVYGVGKVVGLGWNRKLLLWLAAVGVGSGGGGEAGLSQHLRRLLDYHIIIVVLVVLFVLVHTSGSRFLNVELIKIFNFFYKKLKNFSVLWIRIRDPDPYSIRSVDPDPYSESGSGSRRAKMAHKSRQ